MLRTIVLGLLLIVGLVKAEDVKIPSDILVLENIYGKGTEQDLNSYYGYIVTDHGDNLLGKLQTYEEFNVRDTLPKILHALYNKDKDLKKCMVIGGSYLAYRGYPYTPDVDIPTIRVENIDPTLTAALDYTHIANACLTGSYIPKK